MAGLLLVLGLGARGEAAEFTCAGGNVACLAAAITTANGLGEPSTIYLQIGLYSLTAVDNMTDGPNGLPSVTGTLTIRPVTFNIPGGSGPVIERTNEAPDFRLVHVAPTGVLTLEELFLRGGSAAGDRPFGGAILNNGGTLILRRTRVYQNHATGGVAYGAGLFNNEVTVILLGGDAARPL